MKKFTPAFLRLFLGIWGLGLGTWGFSQSPPNGINYQAVARDAGGNPLVSTAVSVDFLIHSGSIGGPIVYSENQNSTTNAFGLFTLVIGSVDPPTFSGIQWNTDKFYLEVIVNGLGMGTTQFLSVPYAYHSKMADSITSPTLRVWTKSADTLRTSYLNDYVGIGTASPKEKLHIVKPAGGMNPHVLLESTGGSFDIGYKIKTGGPNEWLLGKENGEFGLFKIKNITNGFTGFSMTANKAGIGTESPQEFFHVRPDKNFTFDSSFVVAADGKIGIGTISPANKVHIVGTANTDIVNVSDGTASAAIYVNNGSGLAPVQFGSLTNHKLGFFTNNGVGAPAMIINTSSNVGIGITNPATRLDVVSSYTTAPYTIQSFNTAAASATNNVSAVFGVANGNNAAAVSKYGGWFQTQSGTGTNYGVRGDVLGGSGTNYGAYGNVVTSAGTGTNIGGYFSAANGVSNTGGYFSASGGTTNYAAIFDFGNVGIATLSPSSHLDINGSLALPTRAATNATTLGANDFFLFISGAASVITLPAANSCPGRVYVIANRSALTWNTDINYIGTNGVATNTITGVNTLKLVSDGTNWQAW